MTKSKKCEHGMMPWECSDCTDNNYNGEVIMNVINIVSTYLKENEYDGLFCAGVCACKRDDLAPCGEIQGNCEAGYLQTVEGCSEHDWHIGKTKGVGTCDEEDECG